MPILNRQMVNLLGKRMGEFNAAPDLSGYAKLTDIGSPKVLYSLLKMVLK